MKPLRAGYEEKLKQLLRNGYSLSVLCLDNTDEYWVSLMSFYIDEQWAKTKHSVLNVAIEMAIDELWKKLDGEDFGRAITSRA